MSPTTLIVAALLIFILGEYSSRRERVDPMTAAALALIGRGVGFVLFLSGLVWAVRT